MRLLITGICGFVGSSVARNIRETRTDFEILGIDNFTRPGSEVNRAALRGLGVRVLQGDVRVASDLDALPPADWVIDAAANPTVLAGIRGSVTPRQVLEHNLVGTVNVLEYCRRHGAGIILLSTSRVYSIRDLAALPLEVRHDGFALSSTDSLPPGASSLGISETFSSEPPLSLYGSAKRASEILALEYSAAFSLPVRIVRCGVLAGAGQFGRPDQGIFAFWIHGWLRGRPLRYIGYGGRGDQVRDCLHPRDLTRLLLLQMARPGVLPPEESLCNAGGGRESAMSLRGLSEWCSASFGGRSVSSDPQERLMDVPWLVLDASRARLRWGWSPEIPIVAILNEIAEFARVQPGWLDISEA
jgi:CDP-paratose 2-epimerase